MADIRSRAVRSVSSTSSRALVAVFVGGALALAACSSSASSPSSGTSSSVAGGSSASATGTATGSAASSGDIVVGGITDGTNVGLAQGFQARIDRFNAAGGIGGRKIKFLGALDSGGSPSANLANAQTLVLKDHVFALAPYEDEGWNPSSSALLEQNNIPYIGYAVSPANCIGNNAFPETGCAATTGYTSLNGWTEVASALGMKPSQLKVAVVGLDVAGGASGTKTITFAAKASGADIVYSQASVPLSVTDYTPYVQAVMAGNPNVVYVAISFAGAASLTAALRQAGYKGAIVNPTAYVPGLLVQQKQLAEALDGSLVQSGFPPLEGGSAATKQALSDVTTDKQGTQLSLGIEVGWFSADEFIAELQAVAKAGLPLTSANFVKVIHGGFTYNSGAGSISLKFPLNQTEPIGCTGLLTVESNGTYKLAAPFTCPAGPPVKVTG